VSFVIIFGTLSFPADRKPAGVVLADEKLISRGDDHRSRGSFRLRRANVREVWNNCHF